MLAGLNYDQRVDAGKRIEKKILDGLRSKGIKIEDPTSSQDMHDKIDGWWVGKSGGKHPVQVKFRQSGDDVLFEIVKDLDRNQMGRDMKSKSTLYIVANRNGNTKLFHVEPFKKLAQQILDTVQRDTKSDPRKETWSGSGWEAKIQFDRSSGSKKLVAYFNPTVFKPIASWDLNLSEAILRESIKKEVVSVLKELFH